MAHTATAAPDHEPVTPAASVPPARRETTLTVPCGTCDTLVALTFSVEAALEAYGGVFHRGPSWDGCPECGAVVAVTDCARGEHRMTELHAEGRSVVACLVCGPRYRPAPLAQITVVGGGAA
jgi:hypothetical protein